MVALVLVSHSEKLALGIVELARQMAPDCPFAIAAGVDDPDHPIGTDAVKIATAIEKNMTDDGLVVLVDLGSAILSAQTALDLLSPELAAKVSIAPAPLVEGTIAAAVAAAAGAPRAEVVAEACAALRAKQEALEDQQEAPHSASAPEWLSAARGETLTVVNPHGLHARPAARLVRALAPFDAEMRLEKTGKFADPRRLNEIATLQVRQGDEVTLYAAGEDANAALQAFRALAAENFAEALDAHPTPALSCADQVLLPKILRATVFRWQEADPPQIPPLRGSAALAALDRARTGCRQRLQAEQDRIARMLGKESGEIFAAHQLLLDDLAEETIARLTRGEDLPVAWRETCTAAAAAFQALESPYLRARGDDIDDLDRAFVWQLAGQSRPTPRLPDRPCFVLGDNLLPSQAAALGETAQAVCLTDGSSFGHAALLCQAAGVVVVTAMGACLASFSSGDRAVLDMERVTLTPLV